MRRGAAGVLVLRRRHRSRRRGRAYRPVRRGSVDARARPRLRDGDAGRGRARRRRRAAVRDPGGLGRDRALPGRVWRAGDRRWGPGAGGAVARLAAWEPRGVERAELRTGEGVDGWPGRGALDAPLPAGRAPRRRPLAGSVRRAGGARHGGRPIAARSPGAIPPAGRCAVPASRGDALSRAQPATRYDPRRGGAARAHATAGNPGGRGPEGERRGPAGADPAGLTGAGRGTTARRHAGISALAPATPERSRGAPRSALGPAPRRHSLVSAAERDALVRLVEGCSS